jgi:endonuclease/exonuclease/phosphatase family metal-dependent hydrolase
VNQGVDDMLVSWGFVQVAASGEVLGQAVGMTSKLAARPSPPPERRRRRGYVTFLLVLPAAAFIIFAGLRLFGIDGNGYAAALLALTPYVTGVGVLIALITLAARRWFIGALVLIIAVILAASLLPRAMPDPQPTARGPQLRVLSANLLLGRADAATVVQLVRDGQVDVLSLQELTPEAVTALDQAGLGTELPFRVFQPSPGVTGSGLAARFPLRELPPPESGVEPSTSAQPAALVDLPGRADVQVVAVHTWPPVTGANEATAAWRRELTGLPKADREATPRILIGDFNATFDHVGFRDLLNSGYADAADERGDGFTPTWPGGFWPPPVTIDHVLVDSRMAVEHYEVFTIPGSDHRAVYARVITLD